MTHDLILHQTTSPTTIQLLSPTTTILFLLPACHNSLEGGWVLLNA
jgi:hypothetical protein